MPASRIRLSRFFAAFCCLFAISGMLTVATSQASVAAYGKLPLSFEPNRGQVDGSVQYLSRGQGYALYLTAGQAVLQLQKPLPAHRIGILESKIAGQQASMLSMKLVGADREAAATAQDVLPGTVN